jgi:hypothetical protein
MTYLIVACAAIGKDCAENTIHLLLFTDRCLATVGCFDSTIFALSEYATVFMMTSCGTDSRDGECYSADNDVDVWNIGYEFPWEDMSQLCKLDDRHTERTGQCMW